MHVTVGGSKTQQMTFSCDYRAEVLTEALVSGEGESWCIDHIVFCCDCDPPPFSMQRFSPLFADSSKQQDKVGVYKNSIKVVNDLYEPILYTSS